MTVSKERLTLLKERNIRPLANSQFVMTPYDRPLYAGDVVSEHIQHQIADQTFLGYWYRLITIYRLDLLLLLFIALFCGVGYHLDNERHRGLSWLYILPRKKTKLLNHKILGGLWNAFIILLFSLVAVLVIGLLKDGFGQSQLPIIIYDKVVKQPNNLTQIANSYHWSKLGIVIAQSVLYLVCAIVFVVQVTILLSTFCKNHVLTVLSSIIFCGGGYLLMTNTEFIGQQWLPFTYLNIASQLDNQIIFAVPTAMSRWGWLVLLAWSLILYIALYVRIKRKKLL